MALTFSYRCRSSAILSCEFGPAGDGRFTHQREVPLIGEQLVRRLTAIFAADVAGYSRLTSLDEEGTHIRLKEHLRVLIDPKVAAHRGHIVKNTGDGLLVPTFLGS
jgi:class 3 adenylate cyclase